MYKNILVPTDGSNTADRAVRRAISLAQLYDATLHGIYVMPRTLLGFQVDEKDTEAFRASGTEYTNRIREKASSAGDSCQLQLVEGNQPHESIIQYINDNDIDFVVMGTHGRSGLSRMVLGSTTERVLRTSPVPIMTVPPSEKYVQEENK